MNESWKIHGDERPLPGGAALEEIEAQLRLYREDLARDFQFRLADVDNLLHAFEKRGHAFFSLGKAHAFPAPVVRVLGEDQKVMLSGRTEGGLNPLRGPVGRP